MCAFDLFPVLIYSFTHDTILRFNPASLYGRWNPQHLPVMEGVTEHGRENPPFFRRIAWLACQTALDAAKIPMIFHFWWMLRSQSSNQSKPNWIHIHALPNWTSSRHSIQPLKGRSMWENPGFSCFFLLMLTAASGLWYIVLRSLPRASTLIGNGRKWWFGTFFDFPSYWEFHHPNWLIFFRRVAQPPTSHVLGCPLVNSHITMENHHAING